MSEPIAATVVGDRSRDSAPEPSDPALTLVFARGSVAGTSRTFACAQSPVTFGRAPENMLAFDPQVDTKVSHRHGRLAYEPARRQWLVEDLGSTNGTYLNGEPVPRGAPTPLSDGDELVLGDAAQFGVAARIAVGAERATTEPREVDEPPHAIPPIPDEAGGGFFDGIKGAYKRFQERRELNRTIARMTEELDTARRAAAGTFARLGQHVAAGTAIESEPVRRLAPAAYIIARRADIEKLDAAHATLDAEHSAAEAAMARWLAEWEDELAGATREADERQAKAMESAEWVEELRRTLAKQLEPWREAAERVHKTSGALLARLGEKPHEVVERDAHEVATAIEAAAGALRDVPAGRAGTAKRLAEATKAADAAARALADARQVVEQLRAKRAEREKVYASTQAAHRAKVSGAEAQKRALLSALEPHFAELGRAVLAVSLPEYAHASEWKSAADHGARIAQLEQSLADARRRLAEIS